MTYSEGDYPTIFTNPSPFKGKRVCKECISAVGDLGANSEFYYHNPELLKTVEEGKKKKKKKWSGGS